jgi:hypothetical protein
LKENILEKKILQIYYLAAVFVDIAQLHRPAQRFCDARVQKYNGCPQARNQTFFWEGNKILQIAYFCYFPLFFISCVALRYTLIAYWKIITN